MLSSRDEKSNFPPDGRLARIISRGNQEMKSQVFYKSRYALLTKGRRLATLKRSPIESSDLNDSYSEDKPVNCLLLCLFSQWQAYSPDVDRTLAILGKRTFQSWRIFGGIWYVLHGNQHEQ